MLKHWYAGFKAVAFISAVKRSFLENNCSYIICFAGRRIHPKTCALCLATLSIVEWVHRHIGTLLLGPPIVPKVHLSFVVYRTSVRSHVGRRIPARSFHHLIDVRCQGYWFSVFNRWWTSEVFQNSGTFRSPGIVEVAWKNKPTSKLVRLCLAVSSKAAPVPRWQVFNVNLYCKIVITTRWMVSWNIPRCY